MFKFKNLNKNYSNTMQIIAFSGDGNYLPFSVGIILNGKYTLPCFTYTPNYSCGSNEIVISLKAPLYDKYKWGKKKHKKLNQKQIEILIAKLKEPNEKITYLNNWQYMLHVFNMEHCTDYLEYCDQNDPEVIKSIYDWRYIPLKSPIPNYYLLLDE